MIDFRTRTCFILSLQYVKELLSVLTAVFLAESDGKDKAIHTNFQILTTLFFKTFFKNELPDYPAAITSISRKAGAKITQYITHFQIFLPIFYGKMKTFFQYTEIHINTKRLFE